MKLIALGMALLMGCTTVPTNHYSAMRASTVKLVSGDATGTGVVVDENCIVTAFHVVSEGKISAHTAGGTTYDAKIRASNPDADVAVVCAEKALDAPAAKIAAKAPQIYAQLCTMGFPLNTDYYLTCGLFEGGDRYSAPTAPGNSGGGVWNDAGEIVGLADAIAVYGTMAFPHMAMMVVRSDIVNLLDKAHVKYLTGE